jgi:hypothetical protein
MQGGGYLKQINSSQSSPGKLRFADLVKLYKAYLDAGNVTVLNSRTRYTYSATTSGQRHTRFAFRRQRVGRLPAAIWKYNQVVLI